MVSAVATPGPGKVPAGAGLDWDAVVAAAYSQVLGKAMHRAKTAIPDEAALQRLMDEARRACPRASKLQLYEGVLRDWIRDNERR